MREGKNLSGTRIELILYISWRAVSICAYRKFGTHGIPNNPPPTPPLRHHHRNPLLSLLSRPPPAIAIAIAANMAVSAAATTTASAAAAAAPAAATLPTHARPWLQRPLLPLLLSPPQPLFFPLPLLLFVDCYLPPLSSMPLPPPPPCFSRRHRHSR
jgi:hypothetical protein